LSILICPFCNHLIPDDRSTVKQVDSSFNFPTGQYSLDKSDYKIRLNLIYCPSCKQTIFHARYTGSAMDKNVTIPIYPRSLAKIFPDYIPSQIREDYEEAYAILHYSPKASATLSRRCLQGMIRDFWGITKENLFLEIDSLKNSIPAAQYKAIDALRKLGNIGAHMEKDTNLIVEIEPDEAEKLLKLIEILMQQWYINRHDQEDLYREIAEISSTKEAERGK
jgi:gp7